MYRKVDTNLDFASREKEVENFWAENNIAQKAIDQREGCKNFTFYDGPPTANGQPHVGHVLTRVIKDLFPRYHSMKGEKVLRKAGWDTHGLPVELEVEKLIGINGKEQIEAYGIEPFIKKCRESVWKYKTMWEEFSGVVGFWADMDNPYITYENYYIESEWWALKEIWKKGLLYQFACLYHLLTAPHHVRRPLVHGHCRRICLHCSGSYELGVADAFFRQDDPVPGIEAAFIIF